MSKSEIDIVDAVRQAVTWRDDGWQKVAFIGSVIIGYISGPDFRREWLSATHSFGRYGSNSYFSNSETKAKEHVFKDFAEFCKAAGLLPAKACQDE